MGALWIPAALIAGLLLLAALPPPKQEPPPSRNSPPADTLPDKPIPMEHEHGEEEDTTCET